jgi:hypothetical protein
MSGESATIDTTTDLPTATTVGLAGVAIRAKVSALCDRTLTP